MDMPDGNVYIEQAVVGFGYKVLDHGPPEDVERVYERFKKECDIGNGVALRMNIDANVDLTDSLTRFIFGLLGLKFIDTLFTLEKSDNYDKVEDEMFRVHEEEQEQAQKQ